MKSGRYKVFCSCCAWEMEGYVGEHMIADVLSYWFCPWCKGRRWVDALKVG